MIAGTLAAVATAVVVSVVAAFWRPQPPGGAAGTVRAYLSDLRAERFPAAYDRLCMPLKVERSGAWFAAAKRSEEMRRGRIVSFNVTRVDLAMQPARGAAGTVFVAIGRGGRPTVAETVEVGRESGRYCVSSDTSFQTPSGGPGSGDGGTGDGGSGDSGTGGPLGPVREV